MLMPINQYCKSVKDRIPRKVCLEMDLHGHQLPMYWLFKREAEEGREENKERERERERESERGRKTERGRERELVGYLVIGYMRQTSPPIFFMETLRASVS